MTANEQALYAEMQELGYSHGLCITALQILSQSKTAVSKMLAYLYDNKPTEETFIEALAKNVRTVSRFFKKNNTTPCA